MIVTNLGGLEEEECRSLTPVIPYDPLDSNLDGYTHLTDLSAVDYVDLVDYYWNGDDGYLGILLEIYNAS